MSVAFVARAGLSVDAKLAEFVEQKVAPGLSISASTFWTGLAQLYNEFADDNCALLAQRDALQARIDAWHDDKGPPADVAAYRSFLFDIGYLTPEPDAFTINPSGVDAEVASVAAPQLVVPARNARFVLNAANARWGSLYDALYGSDALVAPIEGQSAYDPERGALVVSRVRDFLDEIAPLASGSHRDVEAYRIVEGELDPALQEASAFAGHCGDGFAPRSIFLRHNGLHVEIVIDRASAIGAHDRAGVADVRLEAALTTIVDLEDSIAAIDADDKVEAYANWLGLMKGDLEETFLKGDRMLRRTLADHKAYIARDGATRVLPGRSLLFVRNVGHHMRTPAVRNASGAPAFEGILDAALTSYIALHDLKRAPAQRNSRCGSIYIVKPKMHGPEEARFADRLLAAVEDMLKLDRGVIKIGLMDEERRTSANLASCIAAVAGRIAFTNTGFLDRTGDEIHTSMRAGPMMRKDEIKGSTWLKAYEDRSVRIALACGFSGRAQIGKGMWAMPDRMADMLAQKINHPRAGATTAWAPSPTAATLHALHYHEVDVFESHEKLARETPPPLDALLTIPLGDPPTDPDERRLEIENNIQGVLGYVVRWVDQGVGCSKVPNLDNIGLMEDRATLRISCQHLGNWLWHGVVSPEEVDAAFVRMAAKVDWQNANDPNYRPMAPDLASSAAYQAARALVRDAGATACGYTEEALHEYRARVKAGA